MSLARGVVHTIPTPEKKGEWINEYNGRALSHHRYKDVAISAGSESARQLRVAHAVHEEDDVTLAFVDVVHPATGRYVQEAAAKWKGLPIHPHRRDHGRLRR